MGKTKKSNPSGANNATNQKPHSKQELFDFEEPQDGDWFLGDPDALLEAARGVRLGKDPLQARPSQEPPDDPTDLVQWPPRGFNTPPSPLLEPTSPSGSSDADMLSKIQSLDEMVHSEVLSDENVLDLPSMDGWPSVDIDSLPEPTRQSMKDATSTSMGMPSPTQGRSAAKRPSGGLKSASTTSIGHPGLAPKKPASPVTQVPSSQELQALRRKLQKNKVRNIFSDDPPTNALTRRPGLPKPPPPPEPPDDDATLMPGDPLLGSLDVPSDDVWRTQETIHNAPEITPWRVEVNVATPPPEESQPDDGELVQITSLEEDDVHEPEILTFSSHRTPSKGSTSPGKFGGEYRHKRVSPLPKTLYGDEEDESTTLHDPRIAQQKSAVKEDDAPFAAAKTMPFIRSIHDPPPAENTSLTPLGTHMPTAEPEDDADAFAEEPTQLALQRPTPKKTESITTFSLMPKDLDPKLLVLHDPEGEVASKYRLLDFKLRQLASERPARTVALAGVEERSGTTITAVNLALIRAESPNARIALVDLNFRQPRLARAFGLTPSVGLPQFILDEAPLEQIMLQLGGTQCFLLPGVETETLSSRLYKHPNLTALFARLYEQFDLILMDLPPVLPQGDINQINALIDVIVLMVNAGHTKGPSVKRAADTIDRDKLIGVILNND